MSIFVTAYPKRINAWSAVKDAASAAVLLYYDDLAGPVNLKWWAHWTSHKDCICFVSSTTCSISPDSSGKTEAGEAVYQSIIKQPVPRIIYACENGPYESPIDEATKSSLGM